MPLTQRTLDTRRCVEEALSRNDVSSAQAAVDTMVDMHEKSAALSHAVQMSHPHAVSAFLDSGCDPFLKHNGRTALVAALTTDDARCLAALLARHLPMDKYDQRALLRVRRAVSEAVFEAAAVCAASCLDYLLVTAHADCNTFCYHDDEFLSWCTPLIAACFGPLSAFCRGITRDSALDCVRKLVTHGADVNKTNILGDSALHWACNAGLLEAARLLLLNGADVNHQNKLGETALITMCEWASDDMRSSIGRLLVQHGADLSLVDSNGWSALHAAVQFRARDLAEILLEGGLDPNIGLDKNFGDDWFSCLSFAVMCDNTEMVLLLLKWNAVPSHNQSLVLPSQSENLTILKLLYEAGLFNGTMRFELDRLFETECVYLEEGLEGWRHLRDLVHSPTPLTLQCRTLIRHLLGQSLRKSDLSQLRLPNQLVSYLRLER